MGFRPKRSRRSCTSRSGWRRACEHKQVGGNSKFGKVACSGDMAPDFVFFVAKRPSTGFRVGWEGITCVGNSPFSLLSVTVVLWVAYALVRRAFLLIRRFGPEGALGETHYTRGVPVGLVGGGDLNILGPLRLPNNRIEPLFRLPPLDPLGKCDFQSTTSCTWA